MRVDTNRVPAELKRAYRAMAEAAERQTREDARLNSGQRQAAREEAEEQCRRELAEGRHRVSRMVPVLWDVPRHVVLAPTFSENASSALVDLFKSSFDCTLEPLSAGSLARQVLESEGRHRDYEDLEPARFTPPPPAAESEAGRDLATPPVPWTFASPEPKDFLGNEFLIWLWWQCVCDDGLVQCPEGAVALAFDRILDMECAWQVTGKQMLRAIGPTRLPEAATALRLGKWPRKAGCVVAADGEQWMLSLQGDRFLVSGLTLPKPEFEEAPTPRQLVEWRLDSIALLDEVLVRLYRAFMHERVDSGWGARRGQIAEWIKGRSRRPDSSSSSIRDAATEQLEPSVA